jgi:hypothetical protein
VVFIYVTCRSDLRRFVGIRHSSLLYQMMRMRVNFGSKPWHSTTRQSRHSCRTVPAIPSRDVHPKHRGFELSSRLFADAEQGGVLADGRDIKAREPINVYRTLVYFLILVGGLTVRMRSEFV